MITRAGGVLALWYLGRRYVAAGTGGATGRGQLPYGLAIAVGGADWALRHAAAHL